jgi:NIMA (never in mitosis gene a)-related kinase 1/4/5
MACSSFFDDQHLCIVMEYCENGDLQSEIRARKAAAKPYSEDEVMETFVQILLGLAHIHTNRILHRDLKSQNIFIGSGGAIKVCEHNLPSPPYGTRASS